MAYRLVRVGVKNTGNSSYTFYVGGTVSQQVSGSGCNIWIPGGYYMDLPMIKVTANPGETKYAYFFFDDEQLQNTTQHFIVKVWRKAPPSPTDCIVGDYRSFTRTSLTYRNVLIEFPYPASIIPNMTVGETRNITIRYTYKNPIPEGNLAYGFRIYSYDDAGNVDTRRFDATLLGLVYSNTTSAGANTYFTTNPSVGYTWTTTISFTPRESGIFRIDVMAGYRKSDGSYTFTDTRYLYFRC